MYMNRAELAAATIACWLASITVVAYGMDAIGLTIVPGIVLAASLAITATICRTLLNLSEPIRTLQPPSEPFRTFLPWAAVVSLVLVWLVWLAWPALLPPGKGPDLTHHLLLIDYVERHRRLVHDPALEGAMGEMAHYTPGAHLLAVMFGAWTRTDGFRAVYPLVAFTAALTAGFVFLITMRIVRLRPDATGGIDPDAAIAIRRDAAIGLIAVLLLLLPRAYFVDAFAHDSYLAQVVSTLFAVAMWWAVLVWDEAPSPAAAMLIGVMALGVFLAWPVWLGPPLLAFIAVALLHGELRQQARAQQLAIATVPVATLAVVHAMGRWGWVLLVRTSGAVLHPSMESVGLVFPSIAMAGIVLSLTDRRARVALLLVTAIVAQAVTLYFMSKQIAAQTPYMAYKMGYLLIYPLAVLGAAGAARLLKRTELAWLLATIMLLLIVRPLLAVPRPVPVVSRDFYDAGQWTRANVGSSCVDYLVGDAYTAYWLHLAVLGNPRASARTADVDRHDARAAIARWIPADGLPYAIADMSLLPDEIRSRVTVLKQFGQAGIIARPGASPCRGAP